VADVKDGGDGIEKDTAPPNAVAVAFKKKEAPPETSESIRLRIYVIASFWAIILLVGLPIWWWTTNIYRANLPLDQMMDWADGKVGRTRRLQETEITLNLTQSGLSSSISTSNIDTSRCSIR
jgi:hypothetical protein